MLASLGMKPRPFRRLGFGCESVWLSFVGETRNDEMVPAGQSPPKASDFKGWTELLANELAAGESSARLRSYLKKLVLETWEYVNWLTHAKNAARMDAEIGLRSVEHLLGMFDCGQGCVADQKHAEVRSMRLIRGSCRRLSSLRVG